MNCLLRFSLALLPVRNAKMERFPELSSQPRPSGKRNSNSDKFVGFENRGPPEIDDAFQAWILSFLDWESNGICGLEWPSSSPVLKWLDEVGSHPDSEPEPQLGKFSYSCRRIGIDFEGLILVAECRRLDGEYSFSSIGLKPIITGWNGQFYWLDGIFHIPACQTQTSDASEWRLLSSTGSACSTLLSSTGSACSTLQEEIGFTVAAQCKHDSGEYRTWLLVLNERIVNDNGRLKLVSPLGALTIPPFTGFHVSSRYGSRIEYKASSADCSVGRY